jgi:para-aminobenzoate synthetase component 1
MLELPYQPDVLRLYRRLQMLGTAVLLESRGASPQARWDILAAAPPSDAGCVLSSELSARDTAAAVDALRLRVGDRLRETRPTNADAADLPFTGGFIGHVSYELGRRLQGLPPRPTRMPMAVVTYYPWAIVQDRRRERSWLVGSWCRALEQQIRQCVVDVADCSEARPASFNLTSAFRHPWSRSDFRERFERVRAYVLNGDCYQINIGQPFTAAYRGDLLTAYAQLRTVADAPFSAYLPLGPQATLLSLSPERFLEVRDSVVETRPIKGTRPRSPDPAQDRANAESLLQSPKERAENLMIVDLLRNDLGRHCATGSVRVEELYRLESYAAVHHLTSVIRGELKPDVTALDLLLGCLPGGSITGAPKLRAMELIDELEPEPRQSWCGSVFYLSGNGRMDSSITIRSLFADGQSLTCWAGGGLVIDSEADAEYQEQRDKVGALLACLEEMSGFDSELRELEIAK